MHCVRPYPHLRIDEIDTTGIDAFACGHIHEDLGITETGAEEPGLFVNVGSLGRVAKTAANITRTVQALTVSRNGLGGLTLEPYALRTALPGYSIFREEDVLPEGASNTEIQTFVQGLSRGMEMEQVDLTSLIKSLGLSTNIEARMLQYLEKAGLA
jgi:hypothetical protein